MKHSFSLFYLLVVGMVSSAGAVEVAARPDIALNAVGLRPFA
jgi:hypothetical protein